MIDHCYLDSASSIKKEIFKHGPVISMVEPFQNFLMYEKGVFDFDKSRKLAGKVFVKVVGWGKDEKKQDYWIVESTWGKNWGENGLAKIKASAKGSMVDNIALAVYPKHQEIKTESK